MAFRRSNPQKVTEQICCYSKEVMCLDEEKINKISR